MFVLKIDPFSHISFSSLGLRFSPNATYIMLKIDKASKTLIKTFFGNKQTKNH